ncbi:hypothetical protein AMECASPLE_029090 [Ameca splendens]|uniref:Uncharacterized protein n=1 Tax=Ameca splendens TaxID=208324 RepID=A0ABV0Y5K5_9TELE
MGLKRDAVELFGVAVDLVLEFCFPPTVEMKKNIKTYTVHSLCFNMTIYSLMSFVFSVIQHHLLPHYSYMLLSCSDWPSTYNLFSSSSSRIPSEPDEPTSEKTIAISLFLGP